MARITQEEFDSLVALDLAIKEVESAFRNVAPFQEIILPDQRVWRGQSLDTITERIKQQITSASIVRHGSS